PAGKAAEQASAGVAEKGWFEGIPARLPALQTAAKAVHRARSAGRLEELLAAADEAAAAEDGPDWGADIGRALLDLAVLAESRDDDPETALRTLLARTRGLLPAPHPPAAERTATRGRRATDGTGETAAEGSA